MEEAITKNIEAKTANSPPSLGWKISSESAGYQIEADFQFTASETAIFEDTLEHYKGKSTSRSSEKQFTDEFFEALVKKCNEKRMLLSKASAEKMVELARIETEGFGPLEFLLNDDSLEEISIIGIENPIRVYKKGQGWIETNLQFTDAKVALNCINKMARKIGRRITTQSPRINAQLPNGERLHASIPPVSNEIEMTIRKFKKNPLTVIDLIKSNTISAEAAAFLWTAMFSDISLLIAGNTGSGKTSTLNAIFSFIPLNDRVIITEETPEIAIPHPHQIRLVSNEELGISMKELIKDTLRMRPDRQIVGEVRSIEELNALFECLLAGQARGTFATFHAQSSEDALKRMHSMGVKKEDLNAINLIIIQRRIPIIEISSKNRDKPTSTREVRRITEISEVVEGGISRKIFEYNEETETLEMVQKQPTILEKISKSYKLENGATLEKLINSRMRKLEELLEKHLSFNEFSREIQNA